MRRTSALSLRVVRVGVVATGSFTPAMADGAWDK